MNILIRGSERPVFQPNNKIVFSRIAGDDDNKCMIIRRNSISSIFNNSSTYKGIEIIRQEPTRVLLNYAPKKDHSYSYLSLYKDNGDCSFTVDSPIAYIDEYGFNTD